MRPPLNLDRAFFSHLFASRSTGGDEVVLRQVLLWCVPALLFGGLLRGLLMSYSPYAFWESDSNSYFGFAHQLYYHGDLSLEAKRRYLYPILVGVLNILPGSVMGWLALVQHFLGLTATLSLGYVVRRTCKGWRWLIVPVTLTYSGLPIVMWFEHAALGETIFISALTFAFGGWTAWVMAHEESERFTRNWWWFFVPFAIALLTKSAGRFIWPGLVVAILFSGTRAHFRRTQTISLVALFLLSLTAGSGSQGSWMLCASAFPLIRLDTPAYAPYKAELRPLVEEKRANIDTYYANDDDVKKLMREPDTAEGMPHWKEQARGKNRKKRLKMYRALAREGILHAPHLMTYISLQRLVASTNMSSFKESRLQADYGGKRLAAAFSTDTPPDDNVMRIVLNLDKNEPIPSMQEIQLRMSPKPNAKAADWILAYTRWSDRVSTMFTPPEVFDKGATIWNARPTLLCFWLLAGLALSVVVRNYRTTLGVWALVSLSYLFGTYAVGSANPRFFVVWPLLCPFLAVPAEALYRLARVRFSSRTE